MTAWWQHAAPVWKCVLKCTGSSFPLKIYITECLVPEINGNALYIDRTVSLAACGSVVAALLSVSETVFVTFYCIGDACKVSVATEVYLHKSRFRLIVSMSCLDE